MRVQLRRHSITRSLLFRVVSGFLSAALAMVGAPLDASEKAPVLPAIDEIAARESSMGRLSGVIAVTRNSRLIHHGSYGLASVELNVPHTTSSIFLTGSITKLVVAVAALRLQQDGALNLAAPVSTMFPGIALTGADGMTLEHLWNHRSGLPGIMSDAMELTSFRKVRGPGFQNDEFLRYAFELPRAAAVDERRVYGNIAYDVLELALEAASGMPLQSLLKQSVFQPLGLTRTGINRRTTLIPGRVPGYDLGTDGLENAMPSDGGSLYSTAEDLCRVAEGVFGSEVLYSENFASLIEHHVYREQIDTQSGTVEALWVNGIDMGYSCEIVYYTDSRTAVAICTNLAPLNFHELRRELANALH